MDGEKLRLGRLKKNLSQVEAAARLRVSQPYLSQLERGRRPVTARVARVAAKLFRLPPTSLPLPSDLPTRFERPDKLVAELAALGYPGYSHVRPGAAANPAVVLLEALSQQNLDARLAEALPWVLLEYPDLDSDWLLTEVKLRDLQNNLGFLAATAREVAERLSDRSAGADLLRKLEADVERSRLAAETTLGREAMPAAERAWLRENRPPLARHWNVLTGLSAVQLPYAK